MMARIPVSYRLTLTVGFCFLVAPMEGLGLQAAGIAAAGTVHALALGKIQMGQIFSAGIPGLLPGALVDSMLTDRHGRRRVLITSVALFDLFSLATVISWDFPSLVFTCLMTGAGLGTALPNPITLTFEAADLRFRDMVVSLMHCGMPVSAALAAALGFSGLASAWQTVFWVGRMIPLLPAPLLMHWLPEPQVYTQQTQATVASLRALFAPVVASVTLLLWLYYFFALLMVYMLINWLPMLLVGQGFRPSQTIGVMFALQVGAVGGILILGVLMDRPRLVAMSLLVHTKMLASLLALGAASSLSGVLMVGFMMGMFATGGQSVLCALAPLPCSTQIRATGMGAAVAAGHLGTTNGPLLAGKMLALGTETVKVMAAPMPGILLAGLTIFIPMSRKSQISLPVSGA